VQVPPRNSGNSLIQKPSVAIKREKGNKKRLGKKGHMICEQKISIWGQVITQRITWRKE
jgi:hypothetical protein